MSLRDFFAHRRPAPEGEFRLIGAPALLSTNERVPEGFFEHLAAAHRPDGYVVGPGCGNALACLQAFPGTPRGLVLMDVDPAVVAAGRMLLETMAEQPDLESFIRAFVLGGRQPLEDLETRMLEASPTAEREILERHRERLWQALEALTKGFRHEPEAAAGLAEEWRRAYVPGTVVPLRSVLAREYGRFHELAARGDAVMLLASLGDPSLLRALTELPGFGETTHVLYLSNVADHFARRFLLGAARARLFEEAEAARQAPSRPEHFLARVHRALVEPLEILTREAGELVWVRSTAARELRLEAGTGLPVFGRDDFLLSFDLEQMLRRFFAEPAADEPGLALYRAAALEDPEGFRSVLEAADPADAPSIAFGLWTARDSAAAAEHREAVAAVTAALPDRLRAAEAATGSLESALGWSCLAGLTEDDGAARRGADLLE
jgi:hypothetical protein